MKPIAVAILNWNGIDLLKRFLPLVIEHSSALASIYVVDNGSTDDSVNWVKSTYPEVKNIVLSANFGYAGGYNKAIPSIAEELIVLLNSDIETTENWLEPIKNLFETKPNLAACQPKIRDLKSRDYFEYAGAAGGFIDALCYPFCRGRIFYEIEEDTHQYDDSRPVFWATGASLIVRKTHYLAVGGLDESLFAHMEEIDLCWRMHRQNFEVFYCAQSTVFHMGGATLHETSPRKTFLNFRNNMIIMAKNLPLGEFLVTLFLRLILDGVAGLKFITDGKSAHTWQIVKAHFAFYAQLSKILKERKTSGKKPQLATLPGTFKGSILWHYFGKKKRKFYELPL